MVDLNKSSDFFFRLHVKIICKQKVGFPVLIAPDALTLLMLLLHSTAKVSCPGVMVVTFPVLV